jgi:hypothetical protein
MKQLLIILFSVCTLTTHAQEAKPDFDGHTWVPPYTLPTPKDWGIERFPLPISFAPAITYKGVEDIRFTPGWGKAISEEYWSYAFLWYLEGKINMDAATIESNLKAYYTGLISVNGSKIPGEKLIPVGTSFKASKKAKGDIKTFVGRVEMIDYMGQRPIILNCKVHWRKNCSGENKTYIFYELSPQPFTHNVWTSLGQLWIGFRCDSK